MTIAKILIAEDHQLLREALKLLVQPIPGLAIIAETGNGMEVENLVETLQPHLVLLDLGLPGLHGTVITERIKRQFPWVKVLILTAHMDKDNIRQALAVGADGYVLKHSGSEVLIQAIQTVLAGECYLSEEIAAIGDDPAEEIVVEQLTTREQEILRRVARGETSQTIAESLFLSVHTVRTHRKNIMEKLAVRNTAELTAWAIQNGIVPFYTQ